MYNNRRDRADRRGISKNFKKENKILKIYYINPII